MTQLIFFAILAIAVTSALGFGAMHLAETRRGKLGRVGTVAAKAFAYVSMLASIAWICVQTLALSLFGGFPDGACIDTVSSSVSSPHGSYSATMFSRDCGAITSSRELRPNVLLRDRANAVKFNKDEIVMRTDWLGRERDDVVYHGELTRIRWITDGHLEIQTSTGKPGARSWNGITISYKAAAAQ